ncbi:hypothetical protein SPRG_06646 [Saprolegnia parasitica CBS 223.65]|uniref:Kinetochore protein NDC80 n=1 Tax=Saprolegnia parasitica (strain CBS 223.65) TaxID=695850 RepID=A0A067CCB6_SAPPC|nr:hypothetical protein SPRG_06646 [Saprolegnia parasitica CBS 223.65]KDO28409.1 hypothetical protein SPRG_06646 [Saprolegnia parasitica CBS 223.65]|eukprot:XP_012200850.1 hypothetical protein SPRG_06646 [Saprolegnia parasitica CBS 223.65]
MRRTTLGPISSSQLNSMSSSQPSRIPVAKPAAGPSAGRQSMSSLAQRRESMKNRLPLGRSSMAASAGHRTHSIGKNGSMGSGRRSSTFGARGNRVMDPRPVADRSFMNNAIRLLVEYLSEHNYEHQINSHLLFKPMKKDFVYIMQFLFRQLDRNFEYSPKIEDDVATCFRQLKYPFPISKAALAAVGSPHSWPSLLAAISWMIELLKYDEIVQHDYEQGDEYDGDNFFEYLANSYEAFLNAKDDEYNMLEAQLIQKIDAKHDVIANETQAILEENDELRRQIEQAKKAPTLAHYNAKKRDLQHDREKLQDLVQKLEANKEHAGVVIHSTEQKIAKKQEEFQAIQVKIAQLQRRIDTQELTAEDLDRMVKERQRLQEQLQQAEVRYKELQSQHWQKETAISEMKDALEESVKRYMVTATRLKLFGKYGGGFDYGIAIDAHSGGVSAATALINHLKKNVVPNIYKFKKQRIERLDRLLDKSLELKAQVESTALQRENALEAVRNMENQERKMSEIMRREKDSMDLLLEQKAKAIEDVELELQHVKSEEELSAENVRAEAAYKETRDAYESMKAQCEQEIATRLHNISLAVSACIAFKENVEHVLSEGEAYAQRFAV